MLATQFRDGNVTPGFGQLEQLKEAISNLRKRQIIDHL
jgi:hypothetical protein